MLGFSSTALHWLSEKPCDITGALHHTMITAPEEAGIFKEQAERDWETILLKRAAELTPGNVMNSLDTLVLHVAILLEGSRINFLFIQFC